MPYNEDMRHMRGFALGLLVLSLHGCRFAGACFDAEQCAKDEALNEDLNGKVDDDEDTSGSCSSYILNGTWTTSTDERFVVTDKCAVQVKKSSGCDLRATTLSSYEENSAEDGATFDLTLTATTATDLDCIDVSVVLNCEATNVSSSSMTLSCSNNKGDDFSGTFTK